jgi:hypothetical protein
MSAYALFVQEAKKPLQEVTNDWRKLSEEKKQVGEAPAFVLGTVQF